MLRDIPRMYVMMFAFVVVLVSAIVWYGNYFTRGSDTLQLNEAVLTTAVEEVDLTSRMYPGALILKDSFESNVWERLEAEYPEGSKVQFDYIFNTADPRFTNVEDGERSSPTYILGETGPGNVDYMTSRPIDYVRIKLSLPNEKVSQWTHISTVTLDSATDVSKIVDE